MVFPKKSKLSSKIISEEYQAIISKLEDHGIVPPTKTKFSYSVLNTPTTHTTPNIHQLYDPANNIKLESAENLNCKINQISIDELFNKYEKNGFIYPEKMKKLKPYFEQIKHNWKKMLLKNDSLLSIYTYENPITNHWASVSSWKENQSLWCCQHLSSNGNPIGSRSVLLAMQKGFIDKAPTHNYNYIQNWFRPTNKYAKKVFGSLQNTVKQNISCIFEHCYLAINPASQLQTSKNITIKNYHVNHHEELIHFLTLNRHKMFVEAGQFDSNDINLENINESYKSIGLFKRRHILLAFSKSQLIGVAIAYRSPIGLNFSLLENRCELIINNNLNSDTCQKICSNLLNQVKTYYSKFEAPYIPVITDNHNATLLTIMGHNIIRKYNQSIWSKDGYIDWYKNVDKIFSRVCEREKKKHLVHEIR